MLYMGVKHNVQFTNINEIVFLPFQVIHTAQKW